MVGLLFPGQGSQAVGTGRDLADAYPEAKRTFEEADDVLGFALSRVAWEGPEPELTATRNAQPAILTHSIAVWRVVRARIGEVGMAAGHSLGEFSAHAAAGSLPFADALRTVRRRGELMSRAGDERPGTMAAVLGLDDDGAERVCAEASGDQGVCVAANFNAPGQVVISGDVAAVDRAIGAAKTAGARRAVRLTVSGAFHSPLMQPAAPGLAAQLAGTPLAEGEFGVVSNVTATVERDPARVRELLVAQLTSPVRWTACVRTMLAAGVSRWFEVGPGNVLSGLLRRIERDASATPLGGAGELEAFLNEAAA